MKAKEIIKNYKNIIIYSEGNGKVYLHEHYPICLEVKENEEVVYLDTGGEIGSCFFFYLKIEDKIAYWKAMETNNEWIKLGKVKMKRWIFEI